MTEELLDYRKQWFRENCPVPEEDRRRAVSTWTPKVDPICAECDLEKSHIAHDDEGLYNYHEFVPLPWLVRFLSERKV
jgi:hypothetical protein